MRGWYLLHPGAGTIRPEIISSLMTGGSVGGGGQTSESIRSSVTRIMPTSSGGSVRDELENQMEIRLERRYDSRIYVRRVYVYV